MKKKVKNAIDRIEKHRDWVKQPDSAAASPYMTHGGGRQWDHDLDVIIEAARNAIP